MKKFFSIKVVLLLSLMAFACSSTTDKEIEKFENSLTPVTAVEGDAPVFYNISERMDYYHVPGVSIAVFQNGKLRWAKGYGTANSDIGTSVDENTLFQAGSISKPIAALAALRLVQEGRLDLDTDVNVYLTDWRVPDNRFTEKEPVTLRRLLTHSAGTTVHGFPGYKTTETMPSVNDVLSGRGNTPEVAVDTLPGAIWRYSGGGYTIMQKVVETITGMPLDVYMAAEILPALGMTSSTYAQPLPDSLHSRASAAYDSDGRLYDGLWHNYPEKAAAGLWTTPSDIARYCLAIHNMRWAKKRGPLSQANAMEVIRMDANGWGLGPRVQKVDGEALFSHGGKNAGFTNDMWAWAQKGAGVVIMTNGDNGNALIRELMMAVSQVYKWGFYKQKMVKLVTLDSTLLESYAGRYRLDFQVQGIGDYDITVTVTDGGLTVDDPNNGDVNFLQPQNELNFIDIKSNDEVKFSKDDAGRIHDLLWDGRFRFVKLQK